MALSLSSFSADKRGYKSYLKALGVEFVEGEFNPMVISFSEFKFAVKNSPENRVNELYAELERVNTRWGELLDCGADDSGDGMGEVKNDNDAWSCKMNARRLVREIEKVES